ncbi:MULTISPECIES: hypothetical protein [unclassified Nocardioides]|uniref:hypothetical protein n=1 Tax=unclassified Nocardioides TaxID=2615069 RepID=UPI001152EF69|nr:MULTISPECIES: hypothetical protein [unclassified Nocardioides]WGY01879.1 hypothetical protein QI633_25525 [Nocardioides sp. QY071]
MSGRRRAWGWVAALRAGATTPWLDWPADGSGEGEPLGAELPGAQQLALLRRLNAHAHAAGRTVPAATAERVLAAGVSGRGRSELALVGVDDAPDQFGPRPVDPDALSDDELLRVASALIADDVALTAALPEPEPTFVDKVRAVRRPWVRSFVVVGMPWRADAVRAELTVQGHRPGGRRPTAYLLADDLETVLVQAWTARSFDQGGASWRGFVRANAGAGHLPPRADLARMARSAAYKYGAERVRVVLDDRLLADELGVTRLGGPPRLGAHAVDLIRRVGEPLGLLVASEDRPRLLRDTLGRRLDGLGGPPPTLPPRWDGWLSTQAERTRHDLAAARYPVLGDLDQLLPRPLGTEPVAPVDAEVLALALGLLLDPVTVPKEES